MKSKLLKNTMIIISLLIGYVLIIVLLVGYTSMILISKLGVESFWIILIPNTFYIIVGCFSYGFTIDYIFQSKSVGGKNGN